MKNYLEIFKNALNNKASDDELEAIIDEAADEIEDINEYCDFYETAIDMYRDMMWRK